MERIRKRRRTYTNPRLTDGDEPHATIARYSTQGRLLSDSEEITGGKKADHPKISTGKFVTTTHLQGLSLIHI